MPETSPDTIPLITPDDPRSKNLLAQTPASRIYKHNNSVQFYLQNDEGRLEHVPEDEYIKAHGGTPAGAENYVPPTPEELEEEKKRKIGEAAVGGGAEIDDEIYLKPGDVVQVVKDDGTVSEGWVIENIVKEDGTRGNRVYLKPPEGEEALKDAPSLSLVKHWQKKGKEGGGGTGEETKKPLARGDIVAVLLPDPDKGKGATKYSKGWKVKAIFNGTDGKKKARLENPEDGKDKIFDLEDVEKWRELAEPPPEALKPGDLVDFDNPDGSVSKGWKIDAIEGDDPNKVATVSKEGATPQKIPLKKLRKSKEKKPVGESEIDKLTKQIEALTEQVANLTKRITDLEEENKKLREENEKLKGESKKGHSAEYEEAWKKVKETRTDLIKYDIRRSGRMNDRGNSDRRNDGLDYEKARRAYQEAIEVYAVEVAKEKGKEKDATDETVRQELLKLYYDLKREYVEEFYKTNEILLDAKINSKETGWLAKKRYRLLRAYANTSVKKRIAIGLAAGGLISLGSVLTGGGLAALVAGTSLRFSMGTIRREASLLNVSKRTEKKELDAIKEARSRSELSGKIPEFVEKGLAAQIAGEAEKRTERMQRRNRRATALAVAGVAFMGISGAQHIWDFEVVPDPGLEGAASNAVHYVKDEVNGILPGVHHTAATATSQVSNAGTTTANAANSVPANTTGGGAGGNVVTTGGGTGGNTVPSGGNTAPTGGGTGGNVVTTGGGTDLSTVAGEATSAGAGANVSWDSYDWSSFHPDTFYGRTPHDVVKNVFDNVFARNNIHVNYTDQQIDGIVQAMENQHWQLANGMASNSTGDHQYIVDAATDWKDGLVSNANASGAHAFQSVDGSSPFSFQQFWRLAQEHGVTGGHVNAR
jgi:regulator of replication initiation timing